MVKKLFIIAVTFSLSSCAIWEGPEFSKPVKQDVDYEAYVVRNGNYLCIYDVVDNYNRSLLINSARLRKAPLAALDIKRVDDYKATAVLVLDDGRMYKGGNLKLQRPEENSTSYEQRPSPQNITKSFYTFGFTYHTDKNKNLKGVVAYHTDLSTELTVVAKCFSDEKVKSMMSKPGYGFYQ